MGSQITLKGGRMRIAVPISDQEGNEWMDWVSVEVSRGSVRIGELSHGSVLIGVGAERPGSISLTKCIDQQAAKMLARWMLDNLE